MKTSERIQPLLILLAILIGLLIGQINAMASVADSFIIPALFAMMYGMFLSIPIRDLKTAFLNTKFAISSLVVNFIFTPLLAWALGALFLADYPALWIGFIMLMVAPCTDWYLVFTNIARGNRALTTSILPVNLILQLVLLPIYLFLFTGTGVAGSVDAWQLLQSILLILIIPFVLANITRFVFRKLKRQAFLDSELAPFLTTAQLVSLLIAIAAMFASQGNYLLANPGIVIVLLIPTLLFFVIIFILVRVIKKPLRFSYEDTVSLHMTTLARNSPVSLAIAVTAFPNEPLIALALVIGPLIELPVLAVVSQVLLFIRKRTEPI